MAQDHPCPPDWAWFASFDGGEHYEIGPCATREEAINEAVDQDTGLVLEDGHQGDRHVFIVAEARHHHIVLANWIRSYDLEIWFDRMAEDMDEDGCGADENGLNHPLDEITPQLQAKLLVAIQNAVRKWQDDHQLPLKSYWFDQIRKAEQVEVLVRGSERTVTKRASP